MAILLKGKPVADYISSDLRPRIDSCKERGIIPTLAIIRVGEREDDVAYERCIEKRFEALGLGVDKLVLNETCTQDVLMRAIEAVNLNHDVHACLVFQPLPQPLDASVIRNTLSPEKDVDGATIGSQYGIFSGEDIGFPPCTADACMRILDYYDIPLEGKRVVVVGRSLVIGRPVACMLLERNATVTIAHSRTQNLSELCREADIIVAAVGRPRMIDASYVRDGQVIIDVGINWDEQSNSLVGDVDYRAAESVVDAITPVPGGVGSVTTAVLASHVVEAAEHSLQTTRNQVVKTTRNQTLLEC